MTEEDAIYRAISPTRTDPHTQQRNPANGRLRAFPDPDWVEPVKPWPSREEPMDRSTLFVLAALLTAALIMAIGWVIREWTKRRDR